MDEQRRALERRARGSGDIDDEFRAAVSAERGDGQALRVQRIVESAVSRCNEAFSPGDRRGLSDSSTVDAVATLVRDALDLESDTVKLGEALVFSVAHASFHQMVPCVRPSHGVQRTPWTKCRACRDDVLHPAGTGAIEEYDAKLLGWFARVVGNELVLGLKVVPTTRRVISTTSPLERDLLPILFGYGLGFSGDAYVNGNWAFVRDRLAVSLDTYEETAFDADEVHVWDNGGETADRFTVIMEMLTDDGNEEIEFHSSRDPSHPQGVLSMSNDAEPPDPETHRELVPWWMDLVPRGLFDAIWHTRGPAVVKIPLEIAERWVALQRGGHWR
jgi:hypothetical protein